MASDQYTPFTMSGSMKRDTSKLNADNADQPGHYYWLNSWPMSLIDPSEGDTITVTKWSPPLLFLDERPFVLWAESYGESILGKQKQSLSGDTDRYKTRSK